MTAERLGELERRVERIEATQQIHALVADLCDVVDDLGPIDRLARFFAPAVVLVNHRRIEGAEAVLRYYDSFFNSGTTFARHLPVNAVVTFEDDHSASYRSSFLVMVTKGGKSSLGLGSYADRLERQDGRWVFVEKNSHVSKMIPLPEGVPARTAIPPITVDKRDA